MAFQFFIHNVSHIFQVRGQLENETWSNIGVVWKPNTVNADDNVEGGLTVRRELSQGYLTPLICIIRWLLQCKCLQFYISLRQ